MFVIDNTSGGPTTLEIFSSSSSWVSTPKRRTWRPSDVLKRQEAKALRPSAAFTPVRRPPVQEATTMSGNPTKKKYRKRTLGTRPKARPAATRKRGRSPTTRGGPPKRHKPEQRGCTGRLTSHSLCQPPTSTPTRSLTAAHSAGAGTTHRAPPLPMTKHALAYLHLTRAITPNKMARVLGVHTPVGSSLTPTKTNRETRKAGDACERTVPLGIARMLQNIFT